MNIAYLDVANCRETIRHLRGNLRAGRQQCPEKPIAGEVRCRQHTPLVGDYFLTAEEKQALGCRFGDLLLAPCARESEE